VVVAAIEVILSGVIIGEDVGGRGCLSYFEWFKEVYGRNVEVILIWFNCAMFHYVS
jgi:hypothetical protein